MKPDRFPNSTTRRETALLAALLVVVPTICQAQGYLYWTDGSSGLIRKANLDGTNAQTVLSQLNRPVNIALDPDAENMYWADTVTDQIYMSTLDGQNVQSIITLGPPTPTNSEGYGLAVDSIHQQLYFTNEGHDNKIFRANLDGSNIQTVLTLPDQNPFALALDIVHEKIYFSTSDLFPQRTIARVNLDGSGPVETLITGLLTPAGLAVDPLGEKLYYTDASTDTVGRSNLDGTNQEVLVSQTPGDSPWGIALDSLSGTMYWAEANGHQLERAYLDGTNIQTIDHVADSAPFGVAVLVPEPSTSVLLGLGIMGMSVFGGSTLIRSAGRRHVLARCPIQRRKWSPKF